MRTDYKEIEVRRANLINLLNVGAYGNAKELAEKVGCDPSYIHQIKTQKKNMDSVFSRQLEQKIGLPEGWLDIAHSMDTRQKLLYMMTVLNIKAKDIGKHTGAKKSSISQWVNGISKPSNKFLPQLCQLLDCSAIWLMDDATGINEKAEACQEITLESHAEMTEVDAISLINSCLSKLSKEEQSRVVEWTNSKFGSI